MRRIAVKPSAGAAPNAQWYKDAVIYELRVRSFMDSNRDGIGDFPGLTSRLDYLQDLGVTALWLLPICPSPKLDDGYDISNYTDVHPELGTLDDFRRFLDESHRRGLRVITELVLNHTSDQHPWFQRARRAPAGSPERDFYVWSDTADRYLEARIIFQDFEASNWSFDRVAKAYFWHRFYAHQPDLNFRNPAVQQAMFEVVDFWFGLGVDGLRLDAVPYLYEEEGTSCENLPQTHEYLRRLRRHIDERFADRMLLAEANQWPEDAAAYFGRGDECHMNFHFPIMPRIFMSIHMEDRLPIVDILAQTPEIPADCQWALFLRNHDELTLEMVTDEERDYMYRAFARDTAMRINLGIRRRLAPLCGNDRRKIELMNGLLLSLPGTPVLYYGDEIGMGDNVFLGDRNGVRTPMQWSGDRNGGFSRANPQRLILPLIVDPEYHYEAVNVEAQQENASSLLWWTKRILALRGRLPALGRGTIEFLHPDNPHVLAFVRRHEETSVLVVANLGKRVQHVELDLSAFAGYRLLELFGHSPFPAIGERPYVLTLGQHAFYWFELRPEQDREAVEREASWRAPVIAFERPWARLFGEQRDTLEHLLPAWIQGRRWFAGRDEIAGLRVLDELSLGSGEEAVRLALVRAESEAGEAQVLQLVLALAVGRNADALRARSPHAVIADLRAPGEDQVGAVLVEALADGPTAAAVLAAIQQGARSQGELGMIQCGLLPGATIGPELPPTQPARGDHRRVALYAGDSLLLKFDRFLGDGCSPELEIGRLLAARGRQAPVPPVRGFIELRPPRGEPITIGTLLSLVQGEGTASSYVTDELRRFHERALSVHASQAAAPIEEWFPLLVRATRREPPPEIAEVIGPFLTAARLLGRRAGELHLALVDQEDEAFQPEPYSGLDQRGLYQSRRNLTGRAIRLLHGRAHALTGEAAPLAQRLVGRWREILDHFEPLLVRRLASKRTRVHGHLHLGNVLYTGKDFVILDLDGDPARSLAERRRKRSPIGDVAALIHSLWTTAHLALTDETSVRQGDRAAVEPWTRHWVHWVPAVLLKSWLATVEGAPFFPADEGELSLLLDTHLLAARLADIERHMDREPERALIAMRALELTLDGAA